MSCWSCDRTARRAALLSDPLITLRRSPKVRPFDLSSSFSNLRIFDPYSERRGYPVLVPALPGLSQHKSNRSHPGQTTAKSFEIYAELLDRTRNECHSPPYHSIPLLPHNLLVTADTHPVLDLGTCDLCPRHRIQVFDIYATIDSCKLH